MSVPYYLKCARHGKLKQLLQDNPNPWPCLLLPLLCSQQYLLIHSPINDMWLPRPPRILWPPNLRNMEKIVTKFSWWIWKTLTSILSHASMKILLISQWLTPKPEFPPCPFRHQMVTYRSPNLRYRFEVLNTALDYNIFFSHSYTYAMLAIASSIFHKMCFPHNWNNITIN